MAMMARTNPGPPQLIGRLPVLVLQPGSAQRLDLVGEPAVVAGVVQLDVGEPAVDVAKARADVAGRRAGVRPHTLPEFRFLLRAVEGEGLGGRDRKSTRLKSRH